MRGSSPHGLIPLGVLLVATGLSTTFPKSWILSDPGTTAEMETSAMIHVIATIRVRPGSRAAFLTEFHRLVPTVRAEEGCLDYGPTVDVQTDIAAQVPRREDVVTVLERWESLDALKAHLAAPHMAKYRERVKDLVADVSLQILEPA